jgi:hypothetical protein
MKRNVQLKILRVGLGVDNGIRRNYFDNSARINISKYQREADSVREEKNEEARAREEETERNIHQLPTTPRTSRRKEFPISEHFKEGARTVMSGAGRLLKATGRGLKYAGETTINAIDRQMQKPRPQRTIQAPRAIPIQPMPKQYYVEQMPSQSPATMIATSQVGFRRQTTQLPPRPRPQVPQPRPTLDGVTNNAVAQWNNIMRSINPQPQTPPRQFNNRTIKPIKQKKMPSFNEVLRNMDKAGGNMFSSTTNKKMKGVKGKKGKMKSKGYSFEDIMKM